jgi:hypothetical protein
MNYNIGFYTLPLLFKGRVRDGLRKIKNMRILALLRQPLVLIG